MSKDFKKHKNDSSGGSSYIRSAGRYKVVVSRIFEHDANTAGIDFVIVDQQSIYHNETLRVYYKSTYKNRREQFVNDIKFLGVASSAALNDQKYRDSFSGIKLEVQVTHRIKNGKTYENVELVKLLQQDAETAHGEEDLANEYYAEEYDSEFNRGCVHDVDEPIEFEEDYSDQYDDTEVAHANEGEVFYTIGGVAITREDLDFSHF